MNQTDKTTNQENDNNNERRKGFHPALVIATVAVVVFVLWFCPKALMNARIDQTEENAVMILKNYDFSSASSVTTNTGYTRLTPASKYTDYNFIKATPDSQEIFAFPKYYGETAIMSYCLKDGKVYKKDINDISFESTLPEIDNTWQN